MWGNLTLASTEKKDVLVPCLKAGHVGVVSVEFIAPALEGTYTSHWRLSHKGQQFGPRVWCSIIVDPFPSTESPENIAKGMISSSKVDALTCQKEVSIGRGSSSQNSPLTVSCSSRHLGSVAPPLARPPTCQCVYIRPSPQGFCLLVLRILVQASLGAFVSLVVMMFCQPLPQEGRLGGLACGTAGPLVLLPNPSFS